MVGSN